MSLTCAADIFLLFFRVQTIRKKNYIPIYIIILRRFQVQILVDIRCLLLHIIFKVIDDKLDCYVNLTFPILTI